MSSNSVNTLFLWKHRDHFSVFPYFFLLFVLFFIKGNEAHSQDNNLKTFFDINDPRNPDCPCHGRQKLAEKEFEKLKAKNKGRQLDGGTTIKINKIEFLRLAFLHKRLLRHSGKIKQIKFRMHRKYKPAIKYIDPSVCFKW